MNLTETVKEALAELPEGPPLIRSLGEYPTNVIDILIFHRIHFHMSPAVAVKSYNQLRTEFVDWNEIRISPIREIQEQVSRGDDSLELSVYIKDLLEFVHRDKHAVDLEPILEENISDIRRYLKQLRNVEPASIELVLHLRRGHPVLPMSTPVEEALVARGLVKEEDSKDRKQKTLHDLVGSDAAMAFHHLALELCRVEEDPLDLDCEKLLHFLTRAGVENLPKLKKKRKKKAKKEASMPAKASSKKKSPASKK